MANTKKNIKTNTKAHTNHKPHTGPRHNPGATSALCLRYKHVMTLYADDKCKERDSGKYRRKIQKLTPSHVATPCPLCSGLS